MVKSQKLAFTTAYNLGLKEKTRLGLLIGCLSYKLYVNTVLRCKGMYGSINGPDYLS